MINAGIELVVGEDVGGGMFALTAKEAVTYTEDTEKFFADRYNVTVEMIREYKAYLRDHDRRCSAMTKKNRQCDRSDNGWKTLAEFLEDSRPLCVIHIHQL